MSIQVCRDPADAVALYLPQSLFLKSFAKLNISVQLPTHKVHGKSISNWELMEKLRKIIQPDNFSLLKVIKSSSEVIRFDAELENRVSLGRVLSRLEDRVVQLSDYPDPLRVRVTEAKSNFPSRHSWDSFFRDAKDMDEMKPGERPDTIHLSNLPIPWFVNNKDRHDNPLPSEHICKKVFEKYGDIRQIDIPAADPYRMQMKEAMRGITVTPQDSALFFEAYVQFSEYLGFVRCMDALRGCKLLRQKDDLAEWCSISVDFDKTKHMTDAAVKRRAIVREKLASRQRAKELEEKEERERISNREARERLKSERAEREKLERMREREERRKKKQLAKLMERDNVNLGKQVAEEQHKLMKVQKKLQAIRLIEELFKRIELRSERTCSSRAEQAARARIVHRFKMEQEHMLDKQRDQLRHAMNGRILIRSALETKKPKRSSSVSSLSSDDRDLEKVKSEQLTPPDHHDIEMKSGPGMYAVPNPYAFGVPGAYPFPHPGYAFPQTSMYYPMRGAYYPPPDGYTRRARGGRGGRAGRGGRGMRMPFFDGPDASHKYYRYFKQLTQTESDERGRSRSRSRTRSRSRRRSYSRSRSRSRRRSYSRSRSRSRRRSRSRSRRTRSHSRRLERSRGRRSRSNHHSRSRSHSRRSRSRSRSKSKSKSKLRTPSPSPKDRPQAASDQPRRSWSKSAEET